MDWVEGVSEVGPGKIRHLESIRWGCVFDELSEDELELEASLAPEELPVLGVLFFLGLFRGELTLVDVLSFWWFVKE